MYIQVLCYEEEIAITVSSKSSTREIYRSERVIASAVSINISTLGISDVVSTRGKYKLQFQRSAYALNQYNLKCDKGEIEILSAESSN